MDLRRPFQVVAPTLDGDVLTALTRADGELTVPAMHALIGHSSVEGIRKAAGRLVAQGVVTRRRIGAADLYRLNREHLAAPYIEGLATLRDQLIARLREQIASWRLAPEAAVLFGSTGRGDSTAASDLDLLVIRPHSIDPDDAGWREQLDDLQQAATSWTGNDARLLEYADDHLPRREPVLDDAVRDGIELAGSLRRLLREQGRR
jgi:predicted nucleotidyltransferase